MLEKNFYWGGATAANQFEGGYNEGGKGLSGGDLLTGGSYTVGRTITKNIEKDKFYPYHEATVLVANREKVEEDIED